MSASTSPTTSRFIQASIDEVVRTLVEALLIVVLVIYLCLGSLRVLIPVATIPLSMLGAALLMLAFGFSVNLLTLLAMVLAIGLVVDDAIVVVENVHPPHRKQVAGGGGADRRPRSGRPGDRHDHHPGRRTPPSA